MCSILRQKSLDKGMTWTGGDFVTRLKNGTRQCLGDIEEKLDDRGQQCLCLCLSHARTVEDQDE